MLEKARHRKQTLLRMLMAFLLGLVALVAVLVYLQQLNYGLGITGHEPGRVLGLLHRPVHLPGRRGGLGGVMVVLPYYLHDYKAFGKIDDPGRVPGDRGGDVMCIALHLGRPRPADAGVERAALPDAELGPLLGHDRAQRLPVPEPDHRLERRSSAERKGVHPPPVDQAADLPLHPLGRQHPHGHGVPLLRPAAAAAVLADRHPGARASWRRPSPPARRS